MVLTLLLVRFGLSDHAPRAVGGSIVNRTRQVNRLLLGSPVLRPVFLGPRSSPTPWRSWR